MNGKSVFIDTNLIVYLYSNDELDKRTSIQNIISKQKAVISTQVVNEFSNVMHKKFKKDFKSIERAIDELDSNMQIQPISLSTIRLAYQIANEYKYSFYDCLIIASALENDCEILYSEDMQHENYQPIFLMLSRDKSYS